MIVMVKTGDEKIAVFGNILDRDNNNVTLHAVIFCPCVVDHLKILCYCDKRYLFAANNAVT